MTVTFEGDITTLTGAVVDQAALRGILDKIWNLNLKLISVKKVSENSHYVKMVAENGVYV